MGVSRLCESFQDSGTPSTEMLEQQGPPSSHRFDLVQDCRVNRFCSELSSALLEGQKQTTPDLHL